MSRASRTGVAFASVAFVIGLLRIGNAEGPGAVAAIVVLTVVGSAVGIGGSWWWSGRTVRDALARGAHWAATANVTDGAAGISQVEGAVYPPYGLSGLLVIDGDGVVWEPNSYGRQRGFRTTTWDLASFRSAATRRRNRFGFNFVEVVLQPGSGPAVTLQVFRCSSPLSVALTPPGS